VSSWDIVSGDVKPGARVLVFDDNGGHPGMQAAETATNAGAEVEIVTPERFFAPEMGGLNHVPYARLFHEAGTRITINTRLTGIARDGNELVATLGSDYSPQTHLRRVDQVVVEHGTLPLDELYHALKPASQNLGAIDWPKVIAARGASPFPECNPDGGFQLARIGDAVASRNIHAAIYEALRLTKDL
jgi:hypothetical protein